MSGTVTIVIPAAGASTRMNGRDKLLEEIDGQALLRRIAARAAKAAPTRVVIGADQAARRAALDGLDVAVIEIAETRGLSDSLRAGIAGLPGAAMIMLADMPDVTAEDMATLIALWQAGAAPILRAATEDGKPGHPTILPPHLLPELAALTGDQGAAPILKAHGHETGLYPLPGRRALTDLDTPADWAAWRKAQD